MKLHRRAPALGRAKKRSWGSNEYETTVFEPKYLLNKPPANSEILSVLCKKALVKGRFPFEARMAYVIAYVEGHTVSWKDVDLPMIRRFPLTYRRFIQYKVNRWNSFSHKALSERGRTGRPLCISVFRTGSQNDVESLHLLEVSF